MLKRVVLAAVAAIGLCGAANAQAVNRADPFSWNGWYVGVNGGSLEQSLNWYGIGGASEIHTEKNVTFFGGTLGYNSQVLGSRFVFGVEADWAASDSSLSLNNGCGGGCRTDLDSIATFRARLGYLVTPQLLAYGHAGVAVAFLTSRLDSIPGSTVRDHGVGAAYGLGIEYKISPAWSIKGEWLRAEPGSAEVCSPPICNPVNLSGEHEIDMFRVGLNWHFRSR